MKKDTGMVVIALLGGVLIAFFVLSTLMRGGLALSPQVAIAREQTKQQQAAAEREEAEQQGETERLQAVTSPLLVDEYSDSAVQMYNTAQLWMLVNNLTDDDRKLAMEGYDARKETRLWNGVLKFLIALIAVLVLCRYGPETALYVWENTKSQRMRDIENGRKTG